MEKRDLNYIGLLKTTALTYRSIVCMGLDPVIKTFHKDFIGMGIMGFIGMLEKLFSYMKSQNVYPGAFKPNLGFYERYDHPRDSDFTGQELLGRIMNLIEMRFPNMPIILDYKKGDIGKSSENYAISAFQTWQADAATIHCYMGSDSMKPFMEYCGNEFKKTYGNRGVYVLNLTSNPRANDFEMLDTAGGGKVYMKVSEFIRDNAATYPGLGAVVGAPNLDALKNIASFYKAGAEYPIPLLIPGVGGQGGKFDEVVNVLKNDVGYDMNAVRINLSSGLTHPWGEKEPAPDDWYKVIVDSLFEYNKMAGLV